MKFLYKIQSYSTLILILLNTFTYYEIQVLKKQSELLSLPPCWEVAKPLLTGRNSTKIKRIIQISNQFGYDFSNFTLPNYSEIEKGCWAPKDCRSSQTLAVVIPYRAREPQLKTLLFVLHEILQKQRRTYCIIVSEQYDLGQFNRGKLMNVGFLEAANHPFFKKHGGPTCFSFHDVDMLPESDLNFFSCIENAAIHQCDLIKMYGYTLQFTAGGTFSAGGSSLISKDQYLYVNGHTNWYWGWGEEDKDMGARLRYHPPPVGEGYARKNEEYFKIVNGLSTFGGSHSFYRQSLHGYYSQLQHTHGFTNGPAHRKMAISSILAGEITKNSIQKIRKFRIGIHDGWLQKTKKFTTGWDGVKNTSYVLKEISYEKFYTKVTADIRPAVLTKTEIKMDGKLVLKENSEIKNLHKLPNLGVDECRYVHYPGVFIDGPVINTTNTEYENFSFEERMVIGKRACDDMFAKYHGQCNAFSMRRASTPRTAPTNLKTSGDKNDMVILKHCPHMGWFKVIDKPIKVKSNQLNIDFKLYVDWNEKPIGGLFYSDKLHYEGKPLSSRNFRVAPKVPIDTSEVFPNSKVNLRVKDGEISVKINFQDIYAGVYLLNIRILDKVSQPHIDTNVIFRIEGENVKQMEDEDIKTLEVLNRNKTEVMKEIEDDIAKHFGVDNDELYIFEVKNRGSVPIKY